MGKLEKNYRINVPDALKEEYNSALATQDLARLRAVLLSAATAQQKEKIRLLLPDDLLAQ